MIISPLATQTVITVEITHAVLAEIYLDRMRLTVSLMHRCYRWHLQSRECMHRLIVDVFVRSGA